MKSNQESLWEEVVCAFDVTFREDACRVRSGYGPENLSTLRKLALQLITQQGDQLSLQKRRVKAAYDIGYLKKSFLDIMRLPYTYTDGSLYNKNESYLSLQRHKAIKTRQSLFWGMHRLY